MAVGEVVLGGLALGLAELRHCARHAAVFRLTQAHKGRKRGRDSGHALHFKATVGDQFCLAGQDLHLLGAEQLPPRPFGDAVRRDKSQKILIKWVMGDFYQRFRPFRKSKKRGVHGRGRAKIGASKAINGCNGVEGLNEQ